MLAGNLTPEEEAAIRKRLEEIERERRELLAAQAAGIDARLSALDDEEAELRRRRPRDSLRALEAMLPEPERRRRKQPVLRQHCRLWEWLACERHGRLRRSQPRTGREL